MPVPDFMAIHPAAVIIYYSEPDSSPLVQLKLRRMHLVVSCKVENRIYKILSEAIQINRWMYCMYVPEVVRVLSGNMRQQKVDYYLLSKVPRGLQRNWILKIHNKIHTQIKMNNHFSLVFPQPQTFNGRDPAVVSVLRQADEEPGGSKCFPGVSANGVQRGEHVVLAGLWRPQTGNEQECHRGESAVHLWRLHFYIVAKRGRSGHVWLRRGLKGNCFEGLAH